jgi:hypothetical protein
MLFVMQHLGHLKKSRSRWAGLILPWLLMASLLLSACASPATSSQGHSVAMADMATMSADVKAAPIMVQQAYQFAAANSQILQQLPCYCGCGKAGHTSNYDCYISGIDANKGIQFDAHALGCSICVDITQDAMRLMREGKDLKSIRSYVDQTYSRYGPSNMVQ